MTDRSGPHDGEDGPAHKAAPSKAARFVRLLLAALDPRAWAHAVKIVNYYNYSHVAPLRAIRPGAGSWIAPNAAFSNPDRITIGRKVGIGARTTLWAGPSRGRIVIGDHALFGPDVFVTAAGYRFDDGSPVTEQAMDEADVTIGEDVWIGTRVVILPGVTIGAGAVVAAGAVVSRDVAPGDVVAGVPARKVSRRTLPR